MKKTTEEKIESLKTEVAELKEKKQDKDEFDALLKERNKLKFQKLNKIGGFLKRTGKDITDWADKKNAQMAEDEKNKKVDSIQPNNLSKQKAPDLYDALFGESEGEKGLFGL